MDLKNLKGSLLLILAAFIWGISFVMQDLAALYLSPFTINGVRSIIGFLALSILVLFMSKKTGRPIIEKTKKQRKDLIVSGTLCGICLCIATNFQQFGIESYPSDAAASGRSGFITALYVVIVPIIYVLFKKRITLNVWIAVIFATIGMFLLCFGGSGGLYIGDLIVFFCTIAFSFQLICIDAYIDRVDGVKLSAVQFLVCGILSLILMLIFEKPSAQGLISALPYILYLGIFSCGVAYTLQILGQQLCKNPTVAAIIMSMESVFAALAGVVLIGESFSFRETLGCIIMFAAIILSQLPTKNKAK